MKTIAWLLLAAITVSSATAQPKKRTHAAALEIRPHGFEQQQIALGAGRVLLIVHNRSGRNQVTLRLERQAGAKLREVDVERKKLDWSDFVDLTPGTYVLSVVEKPAWRCQITVTARTD